MRASSISKIALLLSTALLPAAAGAASGYAQGQALFYQNQGNFCPADHDCTGARYLESEFNTNSPIRHAKVYLRNTADGSIIGQGSTDEHGHFTIGWYVSGAAERVTAQLIWVGEHRDNRFAIRSPTGAQYVWWTRDFILRSGTTPSSPQDVRGWAWGVPSNPNALANVYDGAWRTWEHAFRYVNRLNAYFTNLEVRAFTQECPTSCALGADNRVLLDPGSAYAPQTRIMHEMGHIASYKASRDQSYSYSGDFCFPKQGSGCGWNLNTPEWSAVNFEEGLATFYGDAALYWPSATAPHTCHAPATSCGTGRFNVEVSSQSACIPGEERWPLSVNRYLRDAYDSNADYPSETLQRPYYEFFDTVHAFDSGQENGQKDEPWCCFLFCWICSRDGRSAVDFRNNWSSWGTDSSDAWTNNCSPVGD